ncbi:hypothetical protein AAMO2058_000050700 [Amorphochlora amoebiformis]
MQHIREDSESDEDGDYGKDPPRIFPLVSSQSSSLPPRKALSPIPEEHKKRHVPTQKTAKENIVGPRKSSIENENESNVSNDSLKAHDLPPTGSNSVASLETDRKRSPHSRSPRSSASPLDSFTAMRRDQGTPGRASRKSKADPPEVVREVEIERKDHAFTIPEPTRRQILSWKVKSQVYAHFSKVGWRRGTIEGIYTDEAGEWLVVRSDDNKRVRDIDRYDSSSIRPLEYEVPVDKISSILDPKHDRARRLRWVKGDSVEAFFSRYGWVEATIVLVTFSPKDSRNMWNDWIHIKASSTGQLKKIRRDNNFEIRPSAAVVKLNFAAAKKSASVLSALDRKEYLTSYIQIIQDSKVRSCSQVIQEDTLSYPLFFIKIPTIFDLGLPLSLEIFGLEKGEVLAHAKYQTLQDLLLALEKPVVVLKDVKSGIKLPFSVSVDLASSEDFQNPPVDEPLKIVKLVSESSTNMKEGDLAENDPVLMFGRLQKAGGFGAYHWRWVCANVFGIFSSKFKEKIQDAALITVLEKEAKSALGKTSNPVSKIDGVTVIPYSGIRMITMTGGNVFKITFHSTLHKGILFKAKSDILASRWFKNIQDGLHDARRT